MKLHPSFAFASIVASALLAGCATTPKPAPITSAAAAPAPIAPAPLPAPVAAPMPAATAKHVADYLDPRSDISRERTAHFSFDDSTIQPQDRPVVEVQGKYLAAHPEISVRIEGNTDERGSAEYNLALGQRRAESMERALRVFGARDSQMEATSWGQEKPVASGHDEAAWAQNRRAEVVYPSR